MELATEHVRMVDAGRQHIAYSSPLTSQCSACVTPTKTQLLQHGNTFGLTFVATQSGFGMIKNEELERSCLDYCKRRQEALDYGRNFTLDEIKKLPITKRVTLSSIAYWIALSPDELLVAVAYADSLALFEVAHIIKAINPLPFHTFSKFQAQEIAWCTDPDSELLAVLTLDKQVVLCTLAGAKNVVDTKTNVFSISWSPSGKQIALGLGDSTIVVYERDSLHVARSIGKPKCLTDANFEVHHVNWAEKDLLLAGYQKYDEENEETSALVCIHEQGECVELDEIVGFFDVENRRHQYFTAFLPDWRMFFIGCSLSADIELLVLNPENDAWEVWKPLEKYQARLPMTNEDEESFPMGFALNLNSTASIPVDEDVFSPVPVISCSSTEGLLVNFAFVDTTVNEVEFVKRPMPFETNVTRIAAVEEKCKILQPAVIGGLQLTPETTFPETSASSKKTVLHEYGQNDENEFAESDGESSDEEEERKEEEDKARSTFRTIACEETDFILSRQFPKLIKAMGSTYSEEEHATALKSLEKGGKIYEVDFVSWYVNWIFGDDGLDSDDDADTFASSGAKAAEMKSKEEIAAAFSRFSAKEGSWKCDVCMLNNGPETTKCSACETPNSLAPKTTTSVTGASATSAGSIGSNGFSFPVSMGESSKASSFSFGTSPSAVAVDATKSTGFSFGSTTSTSGFSFPSSTTTSEPNLSVLTTTKPATGLRSDANGDTSIAGVKFGGVSGEVVPASRSDPTVDISVLSSMPFSLTKTMSRKYGQNDDNEFAASAEDDSEEDEERKDEETNARNAFRSVASDGVDTIMIEQVPKLFKALGLTYSDRAHASTCEILEKDGEVNEADFISWYVDWICDDSNSNFKKDSDLQSSKKTVLHEYGQNDENEFAESDGESSDEEEERKEEEDKARSTFRTIACEETDFILSRQFPKLIKAMGSTYSEEEHATALKSLEKGGKIYEVDFVSWYVNWIFGDDGLDSDDDADTFASSGAKAAEMKSKEEIAAAFSRFSAKEGSWKCDVCMLNNGPEATKCSACETPNSLAPKTTTSVTGASATSAGSIGSNGFSFPVSMGESSKASSFSFGTSPSAVAVDATKSTGFSFGSTTSTSGFSFPSSTTTSEPNLSVLTTTKPATGLSVENSTVSVSAPSNSGYPPDTTSKPKPLAFGAASGSGYPPDTTSKPKPLAFGAASGSGYPPDTTSKPKPPAFGAASGSGYPPDTTSKPKPPTFGPSTITDKTISSCSFSFDKNLSVSQAPLSASTNSSAQGNNTFAITPTKPKSLFGTAYGDSGATNTSSSPFGVVSKPALKNAFSCGSTCASDLKDVAKKTNAARPSFSFDTLPLTMNAIDISEGQLPTKRTLDFGDSNAFEAKSSSTRTAKTKAASIVASTEPSKSIPSSQMEAQLWKLIVDFDKSIQRVQQSSKNILSKDPVHSKGFLATMDKLRAQISNLCDEVNNLDEIRDKIETDVLFVIGSDGDVHEQLEYGREILNSFNDEALKSTLEAQPIDQRSKETWESLKRTLKEVEMCCLELDSHLSSSKIGAGGTGVVASAHLFRVLKQTYDNSKMQYNEVCKLAEQVEKMSLHGDCMRQANGVGGVTAVETESRQRKAKVSMIEMILETEQRSKDVRRNFLSLCDNVVTPRDAFSTPRQKLAPTADSSSSTSPLQVKACSKLMPKTHLSVASPMSSTKQSPRSVSFKDTPIKSGSKLFTLAEAMAPKEKPGKFLQTPQPSKASIGVGKASQRPSLGVATTEVKPALTTSSTAAASNVFSSFSKPSKETESSFAPVLAKLDDKKTALTTSAFSGLGDHSLAVMPKMKANVSPTPVFSLGGKEATTSSCSLSFGSKDVKNTAKQLSTDSVTPDYRTLLEKFYSVHNPSKTAGGVIEKTLATYKGKEEDLFARLFSIYVPNSTPGAVKKYLNGGPVPPKSESMVPALKSSTPVTTAKSSFGDSATAQVSPFGVSPSAFSPAASKSFGFNSFGSTTTMSSSTSSTSITPSFGKPTINYHQKLVEFYQKYNPDKLSSVDATLQKYKGNEEKLFQNLAVKYKVNDANGRVLIPPVSPAVQPATNNAAASSFGKVGTCSGSSTSSGPTFGSASSIGFGAAKPFPAASLFGAAQSPASSPFGTPTSSGFGPSGGSGFGSGFQSSSATTPAFGAPSSFGATSSGFGATGNVNYRNRLTAFYQQHNPAKLSSVDATLEKYRGREDRLFAMLEQKYIKNTPTTSTSGGFGIPSTSTFGGGSGFGVPSGLGVANPVSTFASASTLGGTTLPSFGGGTGSGFGMASRMGSGFGPAAPTASTGGLSGSGFGAFGSQPVTFGGAAQQSSGFGATTANHGSFGSNATTSSFGKPAVFNSSSFTQMR